METKRRTMSPTSAAGDVPEVAAAARDRRNVICFEERAAQVALLITESLFQAMREEINSGFYYPSARLLTGLPAARSLLWGLCCRYQSGWLVALVGLCCRAPAHACPRHALHGNTTSAYYL